MFTYLRFKYDPIDQPDAADPLERATWCALQIYVGQRCVSRHWDHSREADILYVPAWPIVEWIVQNWWSLFYEVCPAQHVPQKVDAQTQAWIQMHCLRAADSSFVLPALYLFSDGEQLQAEWIADPPGLLPHAPGEFSDTHAEQLDAVTTQESLAEFINKVLFAVERIEDERIEPVMNLWRAIQSAGLEERQFCELAGRMGLNPYARGEVSEELARFFEEIIVDPDVPFVRDLTEVARPNEIIEQWDWIESANREYRLGPNRFVMPAAPLRTQFASAFGYATAQQVRELANIHAWDAVLSVEEIASAVFQHDFQIENRNHIPGRGVRAIVGRSAMGAILVAGPEPARNDNKRFRDARGFFYALVASSQSQRLVTDAYSWDQRASRAFAAELLAPLQALKRRINGRPVDGDLLDELSNEFQASSIVIRNQLENAGIQVVAD